MKKLLLVFLVLPLSAEVAVELPAQAAVMGVAPAESSIQLNLQDAGNHTWTIQSSTDLATWTDSRQVRVFNGTLGVSLALDGPQRYYRASLGTPVAAASATTRALVLPDSPYNFAVLNLPAHLTTLQIRAQDNEPATDRVTDSGAALGRVLFYDKRLSANQTVSCASCHQAEHGFADSRPLSIGFDGQNTARNSMGLTSNRYYIRGHYFWDERAATLEDQVLLPIQNPAEMGMTLTALQARVEAEPYYAELFQSAFGSTTITSDRISKALAQFVRSIVSSQSKYDIGVETNFANFTAQENQGRAIFGGVGNCVACHGSDNFVPGNTTNNNGLEFPYVDKGIGAITGLAADMGRFKVPSLRNIELTAPYMHDGRFATLDDVVEFYNSGVILGTNLSPPLRNPPGSPGAGQPRRLNLTATQKAALVAFLKTLTDRSVTTDPKFSDPFRYQAE
jgi:cytochrome c peroxidase